MSFLAQFRNIPDKDKAALIRILVQNGTPDFDYFYLVGLSTLMATLGLLLDSSAIVIGSMLIAPLMYPILGVALGLVMMNQDISLLHRAMSALMKSLGAGLALSVVAAFFFGTAEMYQTAEVLARTAPSHLHLMVAITAGAAVAYVLARPEWGNALPGVAIAVALVPPLATIGIGIADLNADVIKSATMILFLNLVGITATAAVIFMLMNLGEKKSIAKSTIKKEDERIQRENEQIMREKQEAALIAENITVKKDEDGESVVIHEDIKVK